MLRDELARLSPLRSVRKKPFVRAAWGLGVTFSYENDWSYGPLSMQYVRKCGSVLFADRMLVGQCPYCGHSSHRNGMIPGTGSYAPHRGTGEGVVGMVEE